MIITEEKQTDLLYRLKNTFQELTDCLSGNHLPIDGPFDNKITINGIEYDKSRLIEFDKKELKACILRFNSSLNFPGPKRPWQ